jgi:hypothetical protein
MVILVGHAHGDRSLVRLPAETVALAGIGDATGSGDTYSLDCPTAISLAEPNG